MSRKTFLVYMTVPNRAEARRIGRTVVEERLAACVNILGPIEALYWWEQRVQKAGEIALVAKTTDARLRPLIRRVKALHSYACPCVVAVPIAAGFPPFLKWIRNETQVRRARDR